MPLVTFIVPTFNAEQHISALLSSLQNQSFNDIEILVMDGASGDNTVSILEEGSRRDERVRVFSETDRGIYDAMNKGVARSHGEWLMFMGADDRLYAGDVLETVLPHLGNDNDIVYGDVFHGGRNVRVGGPFSTERIMEETICHQAMLFRRQFLLQVGEFDTRFRICADWDMNIRCFAAGARSRYVETIISYFSGTGISSRVHDTEFERCRLERIAQYWKVSRWHQRLEACRYSFRRHAIARWKEGEIAQAILNYAVFVWHGSRIRINRAFGKAT